MIGVEDVGGLKTGLGLDPSLISPGARGLTQLKTSRSPVSEGCKLGVRAGGAEIFLIGDGSRKLVCLGVSIRGAKELEHSFWISKSSKRLELKLGRAQLRQCQEMEVLARDFQLTGSISRHFLWIQVSHVSHWMAGWEILQGREHTPQGYFVVGGRGWSLCPLIVSGD